MSSQALITFSIPYHKQKNYLIKAIESVFAQTETNWRIFISDDCSTNLSETDLKLYLEDSRVSYFKFSKNVGMVNNWNHCLNTPQTPLVTLLHEDDKLAPGYAAHMIECYKRYPEYIAYYCQAKIINFEDQPLFSFSDFIKSFLTPHKNSFFKLDSEKKIVALARANFIFCPSVCFNRIRLKDERFSADWKMVPDYELWIRLLLKGEKILGSPWKDYYYRRHLNNATVNMTQNNSRFIEELKFSKSMAQHFHQRKWYRAKRIAYRARIIKMNILYCAILDLKVLKLRAAFSKLRLLTHRL